MPKKRLKADQKEPKVLNKSKPEKKRITPKTIENFPKFSLKKSEKSPNENTLHHQTEMRQKNI
jgi:hypothetical protein